MTRSTLKITGLAALAAVSALAPLVGGTNAEAGGRAKDHVVHEYFFDQPMNGHEGFVGAYYCSYVKQKVQLTLASGQTKEVWKLTQVCQ